LSFLLGKRFLENINKLDSVGDCVQSNERKMPYQLMCGFRVLALMVLFVTSRIENNLK